jgi:hypothetical protein
MKAFPSSLGCLVRYRDRKIPPAVSVISDYAKNLTHQRQTLSDKFFITIFISKKFFFCFTSNGSMRQET